MTLFDVMAHTPYQLVQGTNAPVTDLTIDSREVAPGSVFFCIHGLTVNGHGFIEAAAKQGAVAVVVDEPQTSYPPGLCVLQVANTRVALASAASCFYNHPAKDLCLVGVTGTNGKTSTTYFMEAILAAWGKKAGIIGTVETRIGKENMNIHFATSTTPDTVELFKIFDKMREKQATHVAMEVSSHALALHKVDGITFEAGIYTNLTQDHLDFHDTMENYKATKAQLFRNCNTSVINADDPEARYMIQQATGDVLTYSVDQPSELQARNVQVDATGVRFDVQLGDTLAHFQSPVPGKFTVYNMLAAIGGGLALNVPLDAIQRGLSAMGGVPGRIQRVSNDIGIGVIVDYAHTPDGLINILSSVREFTTGNVITVFGCGGDRDRAKRPLMGKAAGQLSDYCIITSDNPRSEDPAAILDDAEPGVAETQCSYEKLVDRKAAIFRAVMMAQPGDTVVIAGKGHENYQVLKHETIHFDDYEVAAEAIQARINA